MPITPRDSHPVIPLHTKLHRSNVVGYGGGVDALLASELIHGLGVLAVPPQFRRIYHILAALEAGDVCVCVMCVCVCVCVCVCLRVCVCA